MTTKANRIERYYDYHELEGDELGQSRLHFFALQYLLRVFEWLFAEQKIGIVSEINFYQTDNPQETPKQPDIALVDGLEVVPEREEDYSPSYYVGEDGPPPRVVIELASLETWRTDLEEKPAQYAAMGVKEYISFDPQPGRGVWTKQWRSKERLIMWRLQPDGTYLEIAKDEQGRIWSEGLESWLVVENKRLRLYSAEGELRLSTIEVARQSIEAAQQSVATEQQSSRWANQRADSAKQQAAHEVRWAETAEQKASQEAQRADEEAQRASVAQRKADEEATRATQQAQRADAIEQERQALAAENARLLEKLRQLEQGN